MSDRRILRVGHGVDNPLLMAGSMSRPAPMGMAGEHTARARSGREVYSAALRAYVARHAPDEITDAVDRIVADAGGGGESGTDRFLEVGSTQAPGASEW
jgi:hypothetical protein